MATNGTSSTEGIAMNNGHGLTNGHTATSTIKPLASSFSNSDRKRALKMADDLAKSLETAEEKVCRTFWFDIYKFSAIKIGVDVGLFNFLAKSAGKSFSAEELGKECGVETRLLSRFLKVLSAEGFVNESGANAFRSNGVTVVMSDYNFQGLVNEQFEIGLGIAHALPGYLKSNHYKEPTDAHATVFRHVMNTDKTTFQWFADPANAQALSNNTRHMTAKNKMARRWYEVIDTYSVLGEAPDAEAPLLVDVGGSNGSDATALLRACPKLNGSIVVQDLEDPIADSKNKLPSGITGQVYDFFTPQPIVGAKNYYLHMVLHDWPDVQCRQILANQKDAMVKGYSRILINEIVVPDQGAGWHEMGVDMIMMTCLSATERTETEWRNLIESSGLVLSEILDCDGEWEKVLVVELP